MKLLNKLTFFNVMFFMFSISVLLYIKCILYFFSLKKAVSNIKDISKYLIQIKLISRSHKQIYLKYSKIKVCIGSKSCLRNCLALKIIFALFGHDIKVRCGVNIKEPGEIDGHAWLILNERVIFEDESKLKDYVLSFEV